MSRTRIVCDGCGFALVYCACDRNDLSQPHALKYVSSVTTNITTTNHTMHDVYGEPNDELGKHECCPRCGFCIDHGDCEKLGCGEIAA